MPEGELRGKRGKKHFSITWSQIRKQMCLPVDPTGNDTELRSGKGRLRLGRLGRGGKPPARGIRPITTHEQCNIKVCHHFNFCYSIMKPLTW